MRPPLVSSTYLWFCAVGVFSGGGEVTNVIKQVVVGLACAWGAVAVTGCSSSDGRAPPVALENLPQKFAKSLCDSVEPCCKADSIAYNATTCKSTVTNALTDFVARNSGAAYDAQAAGDCLSQIKGSLDRCVTYDGSVDRVCGGIFSKSSAIGEPCSSSSDCASQRCDYSIDSATTVCVAPPPEQQHGKTGEACGGDCIEYDGDVGCGGLGAGEPAPYCYSSDGLFCDFRTSVCVERAKLGASCANAPCVVDAFCDPNGSVCTKPHDSGACLDVALPNSGCSDKSYCSSGFNGVGQCLTKKPDGYSCVNGTECVSKRCNAAGTCGVGPAATEDSCRGDLL